MGLILSISPHGRLTAAADAQQEEPSVLDDSSRRIAQAFTEGQAQGLLHLATRELQSSLSPGFTYVRDFASRYLTRLCHTPEISGALELSPVPIPGADDLTAMVLAAPPMKGLEYLDAGCFAAWWLELDNLVRREVLRSGQSVQETLHNLNPAWRTVGRVTFRLAENKHDLEFPFAFLATYVTRLSAQGRVQHLPLGRALQEYAGAKNRSALLALLQPIQRAGERCAWVKELADSGDIYHPLVWAPADAYRFLQSLPALEESGLIVHVPDWWKAARPPRPVVSVTVGERAKGNLGVGALLDFSVRVALDGEQLDENELQ